MTIIHNKNSSIGYDTVNRCIAPVRTVKNTVKNSKRTVQTQ